MRAGIVQLYRDGRRLSNGDILACPQTIGDLVIGNDRRGDKVVFMADLFEGRQEYQRSLLRPLIDPQLKKMAAGENGFVLRGFEILVANEQTTEVMQEWWVRPCAPTEPTKPD